MRRLLPLLLLLAFAPDAQAATYTGAETDPAGDAPAPGVDIVAAAWSFDDAAGRMAVVVTLAAAPDDQNWGVVNASFRTACEDGVEFATIRVNSRTTAAGGATAGNADDGAQPDGSTGPSFMAATNVKSDAGRTTTSEASHPRLVGRTPGCMRVTLSHNGVLDFVVLAVKDTSGTPAQPYTLPGGQSGPPARAGGPEGVRLGSGRRLRFRRNRAKAGLTGVAKGMTIRLSLRLENGTTLAGGRYVARATQPALVTITLTRKGRRWLRAHRRGGRATLSLRTTMPGSAPFGRRYAMRVR